MRGDFCRRGFVERLVLRVRQALIAGWTHAGIVENVAFPTILVKALKRVRNQHQQIAFCAAPHATHIANGEATANGLVGEDVARGGKRLRLLIRKCKSELLERLLNGCFSARKILCGKRLLPR